MGTVSKNRIKHACLGIVLFLGLTLSGCTAMMGEHPVSVEKTIIEMSLLAYNLLPTSTVSGRIVLCSLGNTGHPNVRVSLSGSWETHTVSTNNNGEFVFPNVRTGVYSLSATLDGFAFEPVQQSVTVGVTNVTNLLVTTIITWNKTFGGSGYDRANAVYQTSDCGYVVTGYSDSQQPGNREFYIMKLNMFGEVQWQRIYGGSGSENAYSFSKTSDNGFLICGYTNSSGAGLNDIALIKIDENGNQLWQKTYGGPESEAGYSIASTTDGGSVIAGFTDSYGAGDTDGWIVRTDANGDRLWDFPFGSEYAEIAYSIKPVSTGGFIIVGTKELENHDVNMWILRIDENGHQVWEKSYNNGEYSEAVDVRETSDGGFIVGGSTSAADGSCLLVKLDSSGDVQWQKPFGQSYTDFVYSIAITTDGGFITTGCSYTDIFSENDLYIVKFDSNGNIEWQRVIDGNYHHEDVARSIIQASDGGYVVAGYTQTYADKDDIWILKLNASGLTQ